MSRKIILLSGFKGSGKDTVSLYYQLEHNYTRYAFADPLKDVLSSLYGWDRELLEGSTKESREWRETIDPYWSDVLGFDFSPRIAMTYTSTEVIRKYLLDDIWIRNTINRINNTKSDVVISDLRFKLEYDLIKEYCIQNDYELITMKVIREYPSDYDLRVQAANGDKEAIQLLDNVHPSEYEWLSIDYDYLIENDSTINNLYNKLASLKVL